MTKKMFEPLDDEERELIKAIEDDDLIPLPTKEQEETKAMLKLAADNTAALRQQINIRLNQSDLSIIKQKALEAGMPYQTLINTLIHQYAAGMISLTL